MPASAARSYQSAARAPSGAKPPWAGVSAGRRKWRVRAGPTHCRFRRRGGTPGSGGHVARLGIFARLGQHRLGRRAWWRDIRRPTSRTDFRRRSASGSGGGSGGGCRGAARSATAGARRFLEVGQVGVVAAARDRHEHEGCDQPADARRSAAVGRDRGRARRAAPAAAAAAGAAAPARAPVPARVRAAAAGAAAPRRRTVSS